MTPLQASASTQVPDLRRPVNNAIKCAVKRAVPEAPDRALQGLAEQELGQGAAARPQPQASPQRAQRQQGLPNGHGHGAQSSAHGYAEPQPHAPAAHGFQEHPAEAQPEADPAQVSGSGICSEVGLLGVQLHLARTAPRPSGTLGLMRLPEQPCAWP